MRITMRQVALGIGLGLVSYAALATLTAADLDRLGKDLTPTGAARAGNADNSIPEWKGGLTAPPVGWKPEQGYVDPFAHEKPLFTINGANAEQYKDKLGPGLMALLKKHPNFTMPVYRSHRTAALPKEAIGQIRSESPRIDMKDGRIAGRLYSTVPFPIPKIGEEAIHNHILRYVGGSFDREYDSFPVRANGDTFKIGMADQVVTASAFDPPQDGNLAFAYFARNTSPAILNGTIFLVHEPIEPHKEARLAWIYNPSQRRVRRAPDLAYDAVNDNTDGLRTSDQLWGFNGATDRYDWKLVGKKEMYVPYNTYKIGDKKLKYADIIDKNTIKSDLMRYELHRVWVIEATLKAGQKHIYGKRTFYLDEDSWMVLGEDAYNSHGQLWRIGVHGFRQNYDAQVPWLSVLIWHDLNNGRYLVSNLDNEIKAPITFGKKAKWSDFQADALRRAGGTH